MYPFFAAYYMPLAGQKEATATNNVFLQEYRYLLKASQCSGNNGY